MPHLPQGAKSPLAENHWPNGNHYPDFCDNHLPLAIGFGFNHLLSGGWESNSHRKYVKHNVHKTYVITNQEKKTEHYYHPKGSP